MRWDLGGGLCDDVMGGVGLGGRVVVVGGGGWGCV